MHRDSFNASQVPQNCLLYYVLQNIYFVVNGGQEVQIDFYLVFLELELASVVRAACLAQCCNKSEPDARNANLYINTIMTKQTLQ